MLNLERVLRFIVDARSSGVLHIARGRMAGELAFDQGQLIAASFGAETGLPALEALMFALGDGQFTFSAPDALPERNVFVDQSELLARVADLASEHAAIRQAVPSLEAVPRRVLEAQPNGLDELRLDRSAIPILLAADGSRTVEALARDFGLVNTMRELARLTQSGLVRLDSVPEPRRAGRPAASIVGRVRSWFIRGAEHSPAVPTNGHVDLTTAVHRNGHATSTTAHLEETDRFARLGRLMVR